MEKDIDVDLADIEAHNYDDDLDSLESRMRLIAPNLSALVGSAVAAKLVGKAGGLSALALTPSCNLQLLGAKMMNNIAGSTTETSQFGVGYLEQTEIFQGIPPSLKMRVCRVLAAKSALATRLDSIRGDPTGKIGTTFRVQIEKMIKKWQEPLPANQPNPLLVPESEPGMNGRVKRLRMMKRRYFHSPFTFFFFFFWL